MPNKTKMLDYGGFVHSPETPMSAEFAEYLRQIDLLVAAWQGAVEEWNQSQFSADLLQRKKETQRAFDDFAAAYQDKYTIKHVERDPTFLPVAKFFARYRPIRRPFSILHCNLDLPLHTVYAFENAADLAAANAALGKTTPLRWWQNGPSNHPCYLFGEWIWELKPTELNASDKGLTLLFETTRKRTACSADRLQHDLSASSRQPGGRAVHLRGGAGGGLAARRRQVRPLRRPRGHRLQHHFRVACEARRPRRRTCNCSVRSAAAKQS